VNRGGDWKLMDVSPALASGIVGQGNDKATTHFLADGRFSASSVEINELLKVYY
jgi:hypothetical protein